MPDPVTKPTVINTWANGAIPVTDIVQPSAAYIEAGWPLSTTPPPRQYFNWAFNWFMNGIRYFSRRGMVDYDHLETYQVADFVRGDDGLLYQSTSNGNINNTPSTSPAFWTAVQSPTPATADNTTRIANTSFVQSVVANEASARVAGDAATLANSEAYATGINTTEANTRLAADNAEAATRLANDNAEIAARVAGDAATLSSAETYANGTLSAASTGYFKDPSGFVIQWGTTAALGQGGTANVTFPLAFPSACRSVALTCITPGGDLQIATNITASGFTATQASPATAALTWIAVGY